MIFLDEKTFSIEHLTKLAEYYNKLFPTNSPLIQEIYKNLLDKHVLWGSKYIVFKKPFMCEHLSLIILSFGSAKDKCTRP